MILSEEIELANKVSAVWTSARVIDLAAGATIMVQDQYTSFSGDVDPFALNSFGQVDMVEVDPLAPRRHACMLPMIMPVRSGALGKTNTGVWPMPLLYCRASCIRRQLRMGRWSSVNATAPAC